MAHYSEPSKSRKTFVLRCDRPRYDGGVEIDLERYFGRRLQPNLNPLKKAEQQLKEVDQLREEARRILEEHTRPQTQSEPVAAQNTDATTLSPPAAAPVCPVTAGTETSLWQTLCEGPREMALGVVGLAISLPTLVWAYGVQCPALGDPSLHLMHYCLGRVRHGGQTLLATPSRLSGLLPVMSVPG